jgi:hypothetical protein
MTKATRLVRTVHVTRSTRETVLKEATLVVSADPTVATYTVRWQRLFLALRTRMSKRFGLARMPRSVWRRR